MFSGIIERTGKITSVEEKRGFRKFSLNTGFSDLQAGDALSINGVGVTVSEANGRGEAWFQIPEGALDSNNLKQLEAESMVNLERAVPANGRFNGHFVQGSIDSTGMMLHLGESGDHFKASIAVPPKFGRYCAEGGFLTVNGVSLRIQSIQVTKNGEYITHCEIPHPVWKNSTFPQLKSGEFANLEMDMIAKYIERLCPPEIRHWAELAWKQLQPKESITAPVEPSSAEPCSNPEE